MYNQQLDTFVVVADEGSFNKASNILYISPNAVMKQINSLEESLGFSLFERTHRGLVLTPSGESFYQDAKYIIQYFDEAVMRAANKSDQQHLLKIGLSFTTPVEFLISLWTKVQQIESQLKFELVSFENTPDNAREIMKNFGKNIDMVAGIYSDNLLKERNCIAFCLYRTPICCAVPLQHPLATKEKLTVEDLFNQNIMMLRGHYLDDFDKIRSDFLAHYPSIHIDDINFFSVHIFNQCVNENKILLAINEWKNVHPMLKMIPVEWDYQIPFGILYSPQPSQDMKKFLSVVKKLYK